jgi:hypothetical protein
MAKPTPEQMAEFNRWNKQQASSAVSSEVIPKIIDDDIKEAEELEIKRAQGRAQRQYTAKSLPRPAQRETVEEEHPHIQE